MGQDPGVRRAGGYGRLDEGLFAHGQGLSANQAREAGHEQDRDRDHQVEETRAEDAGARLFLETAALDADAFESCLEVVDHLSADYKLPETLAPSDRDPGAQNVRCVELSVARAITTDVKIVLTPAVRDESLLLALERLRCVRDHIALILQPVTPFGQETEPLPGARLLALCHLASAAGFAPLVSPQTHKLLDLR